MMAAGTAAMHLRTSGNTSPKVLLLEKNSSLGKKLLMRFAADLTEATEEFKGSRSSGARVPALAPELSPGTP